MLIIGIDPGINGAICLFKDGKIVDVFEMPKMAVGKKNKSQVNASQIFNEIQKAIEGEDKTKVIAVIEQVSAMPGQGVTSMFNFGISNFPIIFFILKVLFSFFSKLSQTTPIIWVFPKGTSTKSPTFNFWSLL